MIRLGIIGCGSMGTYHAKKFSSLGGVSLVSCYDRDPVRSAQFAAQWKIPAHHSRLDSFFGGRDCDAVTCALVDAGHAEAALLAGRYGLPLFLEKPMAMNPAESAAILDLYRDEGIPLAVNFSKRNSGAMSVARRLVREGAIGRVTGAGFSYLQSWLVDTSWGVWNAEERWRWRTTETASCLGVLGDLGSHLLDVARFVLPGLDLSLETAAGSRTPRTAGVGGAWEEAAVAGFGRYGGARFPVRFDLSRKAAGHLDHLFFTLKGEKGTIDLDLDRSRDAVLFSGVSGTGSVERGGPQPAGTYADFIALVRGGREERPFSGRPAGGTEPGPPDGIDGHAVQVILDGMHRLLEAES